ncbi:hypothetical protein SSBR45G_18630 [Bradyrhizobium sp. SSBR45G]|uniref:phage tail protein n=1 Tax=unclassified Bradyrhizobium TaxID=2631580 RepID=UPI0023429F48|nr:MULTISPECIES: phage tail protein [unclassified Bradyrhizobium]GLH76955.1 hypothetical protein SSBR45G_18630 [Bradyrhizobium sp. SSBR45G]GLH83713.1 hypothetical protein SSBR45R_11730 [Bradyrhizobium sp. SSBR45R]
MAEPIGSIIAYGGEITPAPSYTQPPTPGDWEDVNGWLLCNGRQFDAAGAFAALFEAVQYRWGGDTKTRRFNIPDLRGYFLRGVDPTEQVDKEARHRFSAGMRTRQGGVGSYQDYATALPKQREEFQARDERFVTDLAGRHDHKLFLELDAARDVNGQNNTVAYPGAATDLPVVSTVDDHVHHIVDGGNVETRPVNAYVHWIIRYK